MLDYNTARRLNRLDQARQLFAGTSDASQREPGTTGGAVAATAKIADWRAGVDANIDTGRMSAGVLALMILGLVGFYWWTRGHQS